MLSVYGLPIDEMEGEALIEYVRKRTIVYDVRSIAYRNVDKHGENSLVLLATRQSVGVVTFVTNCVQLHQAQRCVSIRCFIFDANIDVLLLLF
jgi:hypothetical protein